MLESLTDQESYIVDEDSVFALLAQSLNRMSESERREMVQTLWETATVKLVLDQTEIVAMAHAYNAWDVFFITDKLCFGFILREGGPELRPYWPDENNPAPEDVESFKEQRAQMLRFVDQLLGGSNDVIPNELDQALRHHQSALRFMCRTG